MIDIQRIDQVYKAAQKLELVYHVLENPDLEQFSNLVNSFAWNLGDSKEDPTWGRILGQIKRFRFDLHAAPLTNYDVSEKCRDLENRLKEYHHFVTTAYPNLTSPLEDIRNAILFLASSPANLLLQDVIHLMESISNANVGVLIKEPRHLRLVNRSLSANHSEPPLNVTTPASLTGLAVYDELIVIGSPHWFPDYVFTAPRANRIHIMYYRWAGKRWIPQQVFHPSFVPNEHRKKKNEQDRGVEREAPDSLVESILPTLDWSSIIASAKANRQSTNDYDDIEEAHLCLLENDHVVFIEHDENASLIVVDLEEEERVQRIKTRRLQPGMYILLRTEGGGDYIVPLADRIMGTRAVELRTKQREWKAILKKHVEKYGADELVNQLHSCGSKHANRQNIYNWMKPRGIRTGDISDLRAILCLSGQESEIEDLWNTLKTIEKAHRKAGFHIRELLLDAITETDLTELVQTGYQVFELAERNAGQMAAFRVLEIASEVTEVSHWEIGVPFELESF